MIRFLLAAAALLAANNVAAQTKPAVAPSNDVDTCQSGKGGEIVIAACTRVLEADGIDGPTRGRAFTIRGEYLMNQQKPDAAAADMNAALRIPGIAPRTASGAHGILAEILYNKGDKIGGRAAADKAVAADPQDPFAYGTRAWIAISESRWPAALADIDKSIALHGSNAKSAAFMHWRRGVVLGALKRPAAEQVAAYSRTLELDPTMYDAYNDRGRAYEGAGQYVDAERDFDTLVVKAPNYAGGYNSACWVRAAHLKHEFAKARTLCDQGIALNGEPNVWDSAGLVALQQGRWQDAWNLYDKAVRGNAKMGSARYGRGVAALRLGRTVEGKADIAAGLLLEPKAAANYAGYGQAP